MARKILLADDSVTAQNMGKKILSDAGYEVITVSNGSAALKKVNELLPEIVVLDVYMPGYSGLEVCKLLRENRQTAEIPILLTVGKLEPFKSEEALKARANAFIVKPFEATELLAVIRKIEDANAKTPAKASKTGKLSPLPKVFAGSTADAPEAELRTQLMAPANDLSQDIYVADGLKTGRIMAKDEDVCLHCGLCAERCPTGAWDMQKYLIDMTHAGPKCQHEARSAA